LGRCSTTAPWPKRKAQAESAAALALGRIADGVEGGFSRVRLEGLSTKVLGGSCPTGPQALLVRGLRASNPWHRSAPPPCRPVAAARVRPGRRPGRGGSLRAAWVVRVFSPRLTQRCPKASGSTPLFTRVPRRLVLRASPMASSANATTRQPQEYPKLGTLLAALVAAPGVRGSGAP
jgi:hypothetical protein